MAAARLRPLLGLESPAASREENFAAWQRFLELIAADAPAVLCSRTCTGPARRRWPSFAISWRTVGEVPLLAIGTTRPELLQASPELAARLAEIAASQRGVRLDLEPLSESETEELVARVGRGLDELPETRPGDHPGAPAGNPLFAEQLVGPLEGGEQVEADVKSPNIPRPPTSPQRSGSPGRCLSRCSR